MLKKIYYSLILIGCSTKIPNTFRFLDVYKNEDSFELSFKYKLELFTKITFVFSPIAFLLEQFNLWFTTNNIFFVGVIWAVIANIILGGRVHWKKGDFKMKVLLIKNIEMCIIVLISYPILEIISNLLGKNITGDIFKIAIQIATIVYPAGKALKNAHILSNHQYPPHFIMQRIYMFERDGDIGVLVGKKEVEQKDTE